MAGRKEQPDSSSQLDRDLAELRLLEIARAYREVLDEAARKGSSPLEVLRTLVGLEVAARQGRALERRLREARLPKHKTLETAGIERPPPSARASPPQPGPIPQARQDATDATLTDEQPRGDRRTPGCVLAVVQVLQVMPDRATQSDPSAERRRMPQLPGVLRSLLGRVEEVIDRGLQRVRHGPDRSAGDRQNHVAREGILALANKIKYDPSRKGSGKKGRRKKKVAAARAVSRNGASKHGEKAEAIRAAAKSLGKKVRPRDVIAMLKKQGITVTSAQVSTTLKRMGMKPVRRGSKPGRPAAAVHATRSTSISIDDLIAAKKLVEQLGSLDAASQALSALAKLT